MIYLDKLQEADYGRIVAWNQGKGSDFLSQWAGDAYTYPLTSDQIAKRIKNSRNILFYKILLNGYMIGSVELDFNFGNKGLYVCRFIIDERYRNRGYGRESLDLISNFAFNNLGMDTVGLSVFEFNTSAINCYLRAGFRIVSKSNRPNGWSAYIMERYKGGY